MASAVLVCRGSETGYQVKAVMVSGEGRIMEAKFVVLPEDLRIVCEGDPKGISVGDYVKLEIRSGKFYARKMECNGIRWYH